MNEWMQTRREAVQPTDKEASERLGILVSVAQWLEPFKFHESNRNEQGLLSAGTDRVCHDYSGESSICNVCAISFRRGEV